MQQFLTTILLCPACLMMASSVIAQQGTQPPALSVGTDSFNTNSFTASVSKTLNRKLNGKTIEGGNLLLAISESGETVYGWSDFTATSQSVTLDRNVTEPLQPVMGNEVAAFLHGTKLYAYGARSGAWAVIDLGVKADPVVSFTRVKARVGSKLYLFSGTSKSWTVLDLSK